MHAVDPLAQRRAGEHRRPGTDEALGNKGLVTALLSRLRHQCHTGKIDGPSLRDPQA